MFFNLQLKYIALITGRETEFGHLANEYLPIYIRNSGSV